MSTTVTVQSPYTNYFKSIKELEDRVAKLECVAEAAENFYLTGSRLVYGKPLQDALRAAGYLGSI